MSKKIHTFDNGVRVFNEHLLSIQRERYAINNVHEAEEELIFHDLIKEIPQNGCYLDIGSAIGYYPILAKKLSPELRVYVCEPLSKHRLLFAENIKINQFSLEEFHIYEEAVSLTNGTADLIDESFSSHLLEQHDFASQLKSSVLRFWQSIKTEQGRKKTIVTVNTIKLDDLITRIGGTIDLIQIDVQGHELSVLKGGEQTLQANIVKTFLIGTHSKTLHLSCIHFLERCGYSVEYENYETIHQPDGIVVAKKKI